MQGGYALQARECGFLTARQFTSIEEESYEHNTEHNDHH
jgi:hypothetical protein